MIQNKTKQNLSNPFSLSQNDWLNWVSQIGEREYRGKQVFEWLHRKLALDPQEMSNLPLSFKKELQTSFNWSPLELISTSSETEGGVKKYLFSNSKGQQFESVWLPYPNRRSVCISVQSGCSLDCSFCATGKLDFKGNLNAGDIVRQVYFIQKNMGEKVTNVVYMGMGEPFYNYEATLKSAALLNAELGQNIGTRHITISTSGVFPKIQDFFEKPHPYMLALSVHSAIPQKRATIMDIEKRFPIKEIDQFIQKNRHQLKKNQLTIEYIMIRNFNMGDEDTRALIKLSRRWRAKVNLIPMNTNTTKRPCEKEINLFWSKLQQAGIVAVNRRSAGLKINSACGMLAGSRSIQVS